jgi:hypothetical protein
MSKKGSVIVIVIVGVVVVGLIVGIVLGWRSSSKPNIVGISPQKIILGGKATINGTGFDAKSNTVEFNNLIAVSNLSSADGKTLTFKVPSSLACVPNTSCPSATSTVKAGDYQVSVVSNGKSSNVVPFTIMSDLQISAGTNPVFISIASGRSIIVGWQLTIPGIGLTKTGNQIYLDEKLVQTVDSKTDSLQNKDYVSLTVPKDATLGTHSVWVVNANGKSNTQTFTATSASLKK